MHLDLVYLINSWRVRGDSLLFHIPICVNFRNNGCCTSSFEMAYNTREIYYLSTAPVVFSSPAAISNCIITKHI